jgi:hypothetical protein
MVMAEIYTRCGQVEAAIDELNYLLSLDSYYNVNSLKLLDWVDPLRDNPRFQQLMRDYALAPDA